MAIYLTFNTIVDNKRTEALSALRLDAFVSANTDTKNIADIATRLYLNKSPTPLNIKAVGNFVSELDPFGKVGLPPVVAFDLIPLTRANESQTIIHSNAILYITPFAHELAKLAGHTPDNRAMQPTSFVMTENGTTHANPYIDTTETIIKKMQKQGHVFQPLFG